MRGFQNVTGSDVRLPERKTEYSAGYDFFLPHKVYVPANEKVMVKSGVKAFMGNGEVLMLYIRSSYAVKKGLRLSNCVGIIDADYYNNKDNEGEIMCELINTTSSGITLAKGDRYMQGIFQPYLTCGETVRVKRVGGIGSTDEVKNDE